MLASGVSFVGRRSNNEDTFRVCRDLGLYLVADGMGGHEGGEVASRLAAEAVTRFFAGKRDGTNPAIDLDDPTRAFRHRMNLAIRQAQREVEAAARGDLAEMGTTLAALWLRGPLAIVAHVGDSRVYRLRGGSLTRLTVDHSFVAELESAGAHGLLAALPGDFSAMVTRCLAPAANAQPDISVHPTEPGDIFLLCSDGLTDVLEDDEIAEILDGWDGAEAAAHELTRAAYEAGSQDNITAVVVHADAATATDAVEGRIQA